MAVRVRVQNFQSIEDAEVIIDGMTVVTGPNNSGKTAFMRAIRGVFTNAPGGPLVRHGTAHLTVTLTFDDGTEIIWQKGSEKPNGKGKKVNRYSINGVGISNVGRGVPPEVEALGVREISAASDRLWPQIAQQFDGTLFLVNRPGSAVAEALSDVERVGKLTSALKASEKDRRTVTSELKVRRKDVDARKVEVAKYDGLDGVVGQARALQGDQDALAQTQEEARVVESFLARLSTVRGRVEALDGFDPDGVPDGTRVEKLSVGVERVSGYRDRLVEAQGVSDALRGFQEPTFPDPSSMGELREQIREAGGLASRLRTARDTAQTYAEIPSLNLPDPTRTQRTQKAIATVTALQDRYAEAHAGVNKLVEEQERLDREVAEAEVEVTRLLGDRGVCPTCNTVHEGERHGIAINH